MAQGGSHQEAMAISLSGEIFTVEAMEIAKTEGCDLEYGKILFRTDDWDAKHFPHVVDHSKQPD